MAKLPELTELSDAELDAVAAGANPNVQVGDLVAANVNVSALNGNTVTLTDVLSQNNVQVPIGIAVALLSGATGVGLLNKLPA